MQRNIKLKEKCPYCKSDKINLISVLIILDALNVKKYSKGIINVN